MAPTAFSREDYEGFRGFLEESSGIVLGDNKHYLVSSRLSRLMGEFKIDSLGALVRELKKQPRSALRTRVVDAMTTNESLWFRDSYPFEIFKNTILPDLAKRGGSRIRIWSAASSSGQEAYSLSMAVQEYTLGNPGSLRSEVQIVGTDISSAVLMEAKKGWYDAMSLGRGLSPERKQRFFNKKGDGWEVRPEIRARVSFHESNLLQSYALLGRFDVVFCRNVLIYFSADSKRDIVTRMGQTLSPKGYLMLGASESIPAGAGPFSMLRCSPGVMYQKP